jgi:uncharacterized protein involved in propanediol utilization
VSESRQGWVETHEPDPERLHGAKGEAEEQVRPCGVAAAHSGSVNGKVQHHHVELETSRKLVENTINFGLLLAPL